MKDYIPKNDMENLKGYSKMNHSVDINNKF